MLNVTVTYLDDGEETVASFNNNSTNPQTALDATKICYPTWIEIVITLRKQRKEQGNETQG